MLDADEIAHVLHRAGRVAGAGAADRRVPVADTDYPAGARNAADFLVGKVAVDLAGRLHAARAGDDRSLRHREDVADTGMAAMRDVDDHPDRLHPPYRLAPFGGQAAFLDPVHRSGEIVVEEVRQPRHAEAGRMEPV